MIKVTLVTVPKTLPVRKYPEIRCVEERETYAAVFNDQYQEYKDLHRDIISTFSKFRELDVLMSRLLRDGNSPQVRQNLHRCSTNRVKRSAADPGGS